MAEFERDNWKTNNEEVHLKDGELDSFSNVFKDEHNLVFTLKRYVSLCGRVK